MDKSQVRTYQQSKVVSFRRTREKYGGLSNMAAGFPIEVNGVRLATSEALYQACRFPDRPDVQRIVVEQRSPMSAKMKGRRYIKHTRSDWQKIRVNVMRWCLRVKLAQNWDTFGSLLLSTDSCPIVEHSRKDDFWGAKLGDGVLKGMNILGRLLVELRDELKGPSKEKLMTVEPPQVPDFFLYGQPIRGVESKGGQVSHEELRPFSQGNVLPPLTQTINSGLLSTSNVEMKGRSPMEEEGNKMIPAACKRLAEVDFPIAEVSRHAVRGEVHSTWASVYTASVVGSTALGIVAGRAHGPAAARPVRRTLPADVQGPCARDSAGHAYPPWRMG